MSDARPDASRDGQIAGPPFRWAILGTGPVSRKFAHGLRACRPPARLHAVVSRAEATAAAFAESFGAPHAVTSIRAAAESGAEALYIASPAHLHEAHATEALAAGLPILVEKPLADSAAAAERLVAAARASHLFAAEAVWTRYLPVIRAVVSHLPEIGLPTAFEACFAVATQHQPGAPLFDPAKGGGALLHRGLYPVSLARAFLGPVARIEAAGRIGMTGVDEEAHLLLTHENGAVSRLRASLVAGGRNGATLSGERAMIEIAPPIWRPASAVLRRTRPTPAMAAGGGRTEALRESAMGQRLSAGLLRPLRDRLSPPQRLGGAYRGNGYTHEAEAAAAAIAAGRAEAAEMPLAESIEVLAVIDEARARIAGAAP